MFQRKPKLLVEILGKEGIKSRKKYTIEGDQVIIRKARKGPGGAPYKAGFNRDCFIYYKAGIWPFKRLKSKLMLLDGAIRCISFSDDAVELPSWDRGSLEQASEAHVIKAAGATLQKIQVPTALYVVLFLVFALQFITFLVATGRVKI